MELTTFKEIKYTYMQFFTEHDKLGAELKSYGPVSGTPNTKYNVTSRFVVTGDPKAFACQTGRILVIQSQVAPDLVNVILKPNDSLQIRFSKIRYYIYRGLKKSSFISGTDIKPESDLDKSDFIRKLWIDVRTFQSRFSVISDPSPETFGYWDPPLSGGLDVDTLFHVLDPDTSLVFNFVKEGDWMGNFKNDCGFEIIIERETEKIDLNHVAKESHEIDVSTLPATTPTENFKIKTEREKVLNYIDPAAFWGLYFRAGIFHWNSAISSNERIKELDFYNKIISKYSTKNVVYLDIRSERGRSYNFYGTDGQIHFDKQDSSLVFQDYETQKWPIIIKSFPASPTELKELQFSFEYHTDSNVIEDDRALSAYCFFQNDKRGYFFSSDKLFQPSLTAPGGTSLSVTIPIKHIPVNSLPLPTDFLPIANYYKVQTLSNQLQPIVQYFNNLWKADRVTSVVLNHTSAKNYCYWNVSSKSQIVNLIGKNLKDIVIRNRIVFDLGHNTAGDPKARRLFQAVVTASNEENQSLVINSLKNGFENTLTKNNYYRSLYDNVNFQIYKGKITDGITTIDTLTFNNSSDYELKQSYFQLGIMEEEYNRLFYDVDVEPNPLPSPLHIPLDAQNSFLHLEEIATANTTIFRKYKLGIRFEDNTGTLQIKFPSTDVIVYSVDGLFFFSKEYPATQDFFEEFAKAKVFFRTLPFPGYMGEFGFDWLREGEIVGESAYKAIIQGGYERFSDPDQNTTYESGNEAFKSLIHEYHNLPTQVPNKLYHTPYLNIYSKGASDRLAASLNPAYPKPPHEIELRILVQIDDEAVDNLEFEYDKTVFKLDKNELKDKAVTPKKQSVDVKVKISCIADFNQNKYIKVIAKKGTTRKLAGQIVVCKNGLHYRKEIKLVLVNVITDTDNDQIKNKGFFKGNETTNLVRALYQSLLNGIIVQGPDLDLSNNTDYQKLSSGPSAPVYGKFIYRNTGSGDHFFDGKLWEFSSALRPLHKDVQGKFLALHPRFSGYFTVFAFYEQAFMGDLQGSVEDINTRNVILYLPADFITDPDDPANTSTRSTTALSHEVYHGLGLEHTHDNSPSPISPRQKYIYPHANSGDPTDNVMSYNIMSITLWNWQLKIIRANLNK